MRLSDPGYYFGRYFPALWIGVSLFLLLLVALGVQLGPVGRFVSWMWSLAF